MRIRERRRRKDFCAQTAHRLATDFSTVVIESLKTSHMTRSAKGTASEPGSNVRQKASLNRAILAKGWHTFELALRSAARYTGTKVIEIAPHYT